MSGEIYALICTLLWVLSSALLKIQSQRIGIVQLGALRTLPAIAIYWSLLLFSGRIAAVAALPLRAWVFLVGSTLVGMVVGDLVYMQSLKMISLARAMPLSTVYPFFTILLAASLLHEPIGWTGVAGALLIAFGAYLVASSRSSPSDPDGGWSRERRIGVALGLLTALCWAASTILLRVGGQDVDVEIVNAIRQSILFVMLAAIWARQGRTARVGTLSWRTLSIILVMGIVGPWLGSFTFVKAIQLAGAAKASILTSAAPLFGVPFSLLLKERPAPRTWVGAVVTVAGVWLTML